MSTNKTTQLFITRKELLDAHIRGIYIVESEPLSAYKKIGCLRKGKYYEAIVELEIPLGARIVRPLSFLGKFKLRTDRAIVKNIEPT